MKKLLCSVALLAMYALSPVAQAEVAQAWQCKRVESKSNDDLMALGKSWLDAAKGIDSRARARIYYPVAADAEERTFLFVFYLPNFESWGKFIDAYPDSPVAQVDSRWDEVAPCKKVSGLWATADL